MKVECVCVSYVYVFCGFESYIASRRYIGTLSCIMARKLLSSLCRICQYVRFLQNALNMGSGISARHFEQIVPHFMICRLVLFMFYRLK